LLESDLLPRCPQPGQGSRELAQGPLRNRSTQPALQLLVEGFSSLGQHSPTVGRQLHER